MSTLQPFVHLRVHSEFSIVDSTIRIKELIQTCVDNAFPAVALTDEMNLFAMVRFYREAIKKGIKPIIGADIWIKKGDTIQGRITLLVQNIDGFVNLSKILTQGLSENRIDGKPCVYEETVLSHADSLIALVGGYQNPWMKLSTSSLAKQLLPWQAVFKDNLILEIQRVGRVDENSWINNVLAISHELKIAIVATNDVRFMFGTPSDFDAHQARVAINMGERLGSDTLEELYTKEQYLKSSKQMNALFAKMPQVLSNTWELAKRCNLVLSLDEPKLPIFPTENNQSESDFLISEAKKGLQKRFVELNLNEDAQQTYEARLETELNVIIGMDFPGYFLIVADFIRWSREQNIPVGPGRGSGAGSLAAYALGITNIDPIPYNLLFERFLNPERVSMPDFDIDFCMERRDEVIEYVTNRYGNNQVAQIITFGTMAAKAAIRDTARIMSLSPMAGDRIAKMIPPTLGITLSEAMANSNELKRSYAEDDETRSVFDLASSLEGLVRNAGKHAGGVVIAPTEITSFSPLYMDDSEGSGFVTQFDKNDVESMGLVKFDFLGLRTLTIIQWTLDIIHKQQSASAPKIVIDQLPLNDSKTFDILKKADTLGIFQCESPGIRMWMRKMQPSIFEDIIALVALYRPGPLGSGMVDDFIARRKGEQNLNYLHPSLEEVLKETSGVFLYQEQVMQCAQTLADYTLGESDLLRRAMGKKKPEEMQKQEELFVQRAIDKGTDAALASQIFNLMSEFAEYGFNKSHSAAYAMITYQTAWLKAHHYAAFYTAVMNSEIDNPDRIRLFAMDAKKHGVKVIAPDINTSQPRFTLTESGNILWGLAAIKGFGSAAAEAVAIAQKDGEPFKDLFSFCNRIKINKIGKKGLEILAYSGAMDCFGVDRAQLIATIPLAHKQAEQNLYDLENGQSALFGNTDLCQQTHKYEPSQPINPIEKLHREKALTGSYLDKHPVDFFVKDLENCRIKSIEQTIGDLKKTEFIWIAGEIEKMQTQRSKSGADLTDVRIADSSGYIEISLFSDVYEKAREELLLQQGKIIVVQGTSKFDARREEWRIRAKNIISLKQLRQMFFKHINLHWQEGFDAHRASILSQLFKDEEGINLHVTYQSKFIQATFESPYKMSYDDSQWLKLRHILGDAIEVIV